MADDAKTESGARPKLQRRPLPVDEELSLTSTRQIAGLPRGPGAEHSVTKAIRVRRGSARRASILPPRNAPLHVPSRLADAAFPAFTSLLFTAPSALEMWGAGRQVAALVLVVGTALALLGIVSALSGWLNGSSESASGSRS